MFKEFGDQDDYEDTSRGMLSAAMEWEFMNEMREEEGRRYAD